MDKKLLKEINKLRYLNQYNTSKTLTENKVTLTEQLVPTLARLGFVGSVEYLASITMKLTVNNLAEYFGKSLPDNLETLIKNAISKGRLANSLGMFNGNTIDLSLSMFRRWAQDGSTKLFSSLERNIFYEAMASVDEVTMKNVVASILETAEGKMLKAGTMSDEFLEKLLKDINSPLHGFSEQFLRNIAKTSKSTIINKVKGVTAEAVAKLNKAVASFGDIMNTGYKWYKGKVARVAGMRLFTKGSEFSSQIYAAVVDKYLARLSGGQLENIPAVLSRLGVSDKSIQEVIKAIQNNGKVSEVITREIFEKLTSKSTQELEVLMVEIMKDLSSSKWLKMSVPKYLDLMIVTTKATTPEELLLLQKEAMRKLVPSISDENIMILLRAYAKKSWPVRALRKMIFKGGTKTTRLEHFFLCGFPGGRPKGYLGVLCVMFKYHLFTTIMPFIKDHASFSAILANIKNALNPSNEDELDNIKRILDPPSEVIKDLNDQTYYQFLSPDVEPKTIDAINEYYDGIAEKIGTELLTFVPTETVLGLGVFKYRETPTSPEYTITSDTKDMNGMFKAPSSSGGRWYIGPFLADLNKASDSQFMQGLLAFFSSDWNNISESNIKNLIVGKSRPSRFGIAKVAERYKFHSGRSLWGDLDQLEMGQGILQNFINNILIINQDVTKHNIDLKNMLNKAEFMYNDQEGVENIVRNPNQAILDDYWSFPKELWDVHQVARDNVLVMEEVLFVSEYNGFMPLEIMTMLQAEPSFISEDTEGNTTTLVVKSEADLFKIPAKEFNNFLINNAMAPFKQAIYHYPYIYKLEAVGYDENNNVIEQWNEHTNPEYKNPVQTGVREDVERRWIQFQTDNPQSLPAEVDLESNN